MRASACGLAGRHRVNGTPVNGDGSLGGFLDLRDSLRGNFGTECAEHAERAYPGFARDGIDRSRDRFLEDERERVNVSWPRRDLVCRGPFGPWYVPTEWYKW